MAIKLYDSEYERDYIEAEPLANYVWIETGSDMHEGKNYGVGFSYESIKTFRDYLTSILEGRDTNDQVL